MALQGNLRDFSVTEILQLLGSQKKTGCLIIESGGHQALVFVADGRVTSTRPPGLVKDDPLLGFLRRVHRVSDEQLIGLSALHQESHRDLEDLLVDGRYLEPDDLAALVERQILDTLMTIMRWPDGAYHFDPHQRRESTPLVRLSIDGLLIEIARRADEEKRYARIFRDPHLLLSVRDLPDPDQSLSEDESDLLGLVDGRRTVGEIVEASPLTAFEAYDAMNRMLEAGWIEFAGRREGAAPPPPLVVAEETTRRRAVPNTLLREVVVGVCIALSIVALRVGAHLIEPASARIGSSDVFAATTLRDLRFALELYRRDRGAYPAQLSQLVDDRWIGADQARLAGYIIEYRALRGGQDYHLALVPDR